MFMVNIVVSLIVTVKTNTSFSLVIGRGLVGLMNTVMVSSAGAEGSCDVEGSSKLVCKTVKDMIMVMQRWHIFKKIIHVSM